MEVVYFYIVSHCLHKQNPKINTAHIYAYWEKSKILREYDKPEKDILDQWVRQIKTDLIEQGIKIRMN